MTISKDRSTRWWVLAVAGLAQLMVVLDSTIVTIALPSLQAELGMSDASRSWVVTAYALAFGGLLILGGRLSDVLGAKRAFVIGLIGFAAASALAGAAPTWETLLAARVGQGVFAALLAPAALAVISGTFTEPRARATAFGVYGALTGAGAVVGLLLGGFLTEWAGWRWCLLINVPIVVVALIGTRLVIPALPRRGVRLDWAGALTSAIGMAAVVFALTEVASRGAGHALVLVPFGAGLIAMVLFVVLQARLPSPLLPLRILLHRTRGGALLAVALPQLSLFGLFLVLTYWFQQILGFSPMQAGFAFLPLAVSIGIGSTVIAGPLSQRLGARNLIVPALLVMALGFVFLIGLDPASENIYLTRFVPAEVLIGLGLGCTIAPAAESATSGVDTGDLGAASGAVNAVTQLGGSIGTALLNTVATVSAAAAARGNDTAAANPIAQTTTGFDAALTVAAGLLVVAAVVVALVVPGRSHRSAARDSTARAESR
ncbi:MFS transporter [Brevibacterium samyangense]|uniref:MFS transporter n=1 Tax=Brevibacterium samyangense TaxID=366888 RepID=A0ABP5EX29_9MICO